MSLEIEGKWLPSKTFEGFGEKLRAYNSSRIRQGYIATDPNGNVVRIREDAGDYTMTVKGSRTHGSAAEVEHSIPGTFFNELWPFTGVRVIEKVRYFVPLLGTELLCDTPDALTAEVDVFQGRHAGLILIEVETPTAEALDALRANTPDWFGEDVTEDPQYSNVWLSTNETPQRYVTDLK